MILSIRTYKKTECISFKSTKGKYGALSNMAPNFPISINGNFIRTAEALYQALRFPDFPDIQKQIIEEKSPISAKNIGRKHIEKSRDDWDIHRFKIMKFCLEVKLIQNKESFSQVLLSTKSLPIIEYTTEDKVWGATDDGEFYVGTNALGRLLMELRENLKNNTVQINLPDIENLKLLGEEITVEQLSQVNKVSLNFEPVCV